MKKLILSLLLILIVACGSLFASDFSFVFGSLDQHSEVLWGFFPTFVRLGAGYTGLSLLEDNTTRIDFLVGGGYSQRKVWQDPDTGEVEDYDPIIYDTIRIEWELGFNQGFLQSPVEGKDLINLYIAYLGRYEANIDSFRVGKSRDNGGIFTIDSLDNRIGSNYSGNIYPDLKGDRQHLGTAFIFETEVDMMDDQKTYSNGFLATFSVEWAPFILNSALDGVADYYSIDLNLVGAYTLYRLNINGQHWFGLTLVDRANVNWTDGDAVPVYAQESVSLGRKVRGYNTWTYNTQLTMVNNLDLRLSGPDLWGIFPRINLFFDVGYGTGNYFNTNDWDNNFLMSTGAQFTISFWDFIDLGYQVAYLFKGYKFTDGPDVSVTGKFTFFLDF